MINVRSSLLHLLNVNVSGADREAAAVQFSVRGSKRLIKDAEICDKFWTFFFLTIITFGVFFFLRYFQIELHFVTLENKPHVSGFSPL